MLILLTNDDGIASPGLKAIRNELRENSKHEFVTVAPKTAYSAQSCSHAHGDRWVAWKKTSDGYVVDGSPATCMSIALKELELEPDLVVSGINYGENIGTNLMYSGTLGAAWEAAMGGILSLAISLELPPEIHFTLDEKVDFGMASFFGRKTVEKLLSAVPHRCLLWNLNIPSDATKKTPVVHAPVARERWNRPTVKERRGVENDGEVRFEFVPTENKFPEETDIAKLRAGSVVLSMIEGICFPWAVSLGPRA